MTFSIRVAPPNSLLVIAGAPTMDSPEQFEPGKRIASTSSCVVVGCFMEQDGETDIALGPPLETSQPPAFEGLLNTPQHNVAVWNIEWEKLLETSVPANRTKIRIWTNHPSDPNEVYIGIGE